MGAPLLADPMYWNGNIEKLGTGTEDIITKCREYGLRTPEFHQDEDFRVIIWREQHENDPKRSKVVPKEQDELLQIIKEVPSISRAALSKKLNISERQVRKIIDRLKEDGVLTRQGGNSGSWIVNKE